MGQTACKIIRHKSTSPGIARNRQKYKPSPQLLMKMPKKSEGKQKAEITTTSITNIRKVYKFNPKIIGCGQFGTIRSASLISNKKHKVAVKTIAKEKLQSDIEIFIRELKIMKQLDHPNIINFYETYQDQKYFHLVMEYCQGGSLLDKQIQKGKFSEPYTAKIMEQITSVVEYLHFNNISHRDLKPENFLFVSEDKDSEIRIIDFGLSIQSSEENQTLVGTPIYMAPEVILKQYDERCDNWSLGVILYQLLTGNQAFEGVTEEEVFFSIKKGKFITDRVEWEMISPEGRDLIQKLLVVNPNHRFTAAQALCHPWFLKMIQKKERKQVDPKIMQSLTSFRYPAHFAKEAMKVMVQRMTEEEIKKLKEQFKLFDIHKTGYIDFTEMHTAIASFGYDSTDMEFQALLKNLQSHGKKVINYTDFVSATLDRKQFFTKERLWTIFNHFDVDNSGSITADNLKEAMAREGRKLPELEIQNMIEEVDLHNTKKIDFEDFYSLMIPKVSSKIQHSFISNSDSLSDLQIIMSTSPKQSDPFCNEEIFTSKKPRILRYSSNNRKTC